MKAIRLIVAGAALALLIGCQSPPPSPSPTVSLTPTSTPAATPTASETPVETAEPPSMESRIEQMMAGWDGQSFSRTDLEIVENGPVFLEIVRTTQDPSMKASAFVSLRETYGCVLTDGTRNYGGTRTFSSVVLAHLSDPDPALQTAALRAAPHAMGDDPVPEVQEALARLLATSQDPRIRFMAQEALDNTETRPPQVVTEARLQALNASKPFLVAQVLHDLNVMDVPDQFALQNKLLELTKHESPAVRGEAVKRLADMPRNQVKKDLMAERLKPFLKDPHPYPRGVAVIALGKLLKEKSIPLIMELVGDRKESRYKLEFQDPVGEKDGLEDWTYSWGRVDEAVIRTVAAITHGKPHSFDLGVIFYETRFEDIEREAERARQWYKTREIAVREAAERTRPE